MKNDTEILSIISKLHRRQTSIFNNRLKDFEISYGDHSYLFIINGNPGLSQNELTKYLSNNKATTAKILKRLVEKGFVIKEVDENDKRGNKLFLGEKGKEKVEELRGEVVEYSDKIFEGFDEEEAKDMLAKLTKLLKSVDRIYREEV